MAYFLGIDGGGSKTTCAVGDERSLLATATAGPSNVVRVGEPVARVSLHSAVRQACAAAGIDARDVARVCIGAAGAARPQVVQALRRVLGEVVGCPIEIVDDMQIALDAAFAGGPCLIVNAGTGSFAYGRGLDGETVRVGGWGFAISDEGSAHWIGRAAVAAALRARDAGRGTELLREILRAWKVSSVDELVPMANGTPPPDFSALFPAVITASQCGHPQVAIEVLTHAGKELAQLAESATEHLFPPGDRSHFPPVPLAVMGGVFRHSELVRQVFYNEIRDRGLRVVIQDVDVNPVEGALRRARRACNRT